MLAFLVFSLLSGTDMLLSIDSLDFSFILTYKLTTPGPSKCMANQMYLIMYQIIFKTECTTRFQLSPATLFLNYSGSSYPYYSQLSHYSWNIFVEPAQINHSRPIKVHGQSDVCDHVSIKLLSYFQNRMHRQIPVTTSHQHYSVLICSGSTLILFSTELFLAEYFPQYTYHR